MLNELNFLRASSAFEFCLLNKFEMFAFLCTRVYICTSIYVNMYIYNIYAIYRVCESEWVGIYGLWRLNVLFEFGVHLEWIKKR